MNELPVVDATKCSGCGECAAICPTVCLAMAGPVPWLPRPTDCTACAACEIVCPDAAIALATPVCDRPSASL